MSLTRDIDYMQRVVVFAAPVRSKLAGCDRNEKNRSGYTEVVTVDSSFRLVNANGFIAYVLKSTTERRKRRLSDRRVQLHTVNA